MWTEKLSNVVLDHGCKRYAVCETYVRTHACTQAQTNSQLNTLVWGSLMLAQLCDSGIAEQLVNSHYHILRIIHKSQGWYNGWADTIPSDITFDQRRGWADNTSWAP